MTEIGFLLELVRCWRFSFIRASRLKPVAMQLKLPILGCLVALTAGCSTVSTNQPMTATPSTLPSITPPKAQAPSPAPEFQTPKWELAIPDRLEIDTWVRRFSEDKHRSFQTQLDRARFYIVPVQQIFEERGIPKDIVFVALVESGFSPTARSHASAVGMWQFISSTGKRFGLEQNEWVDERRHPFKAARAAADYLSFLYDTLGSWPLALAAYNAGENGVQGAQVKSGLRSFWELAENGYLPSETRDYVPKVLATVKIIRNPRQYGFHFDPKQYVKKHDTVPVPGGVKLATIEKKAGVPRSTLQDCNPELCKPETPPGCSSYELCVPEGTRDMVLSAILQGGLKEEKPEAKQAAVKTEAKRPPVKTEVKQPTAKAKEVVAVKSPANSSYKVCPGETWYGLSRKYGCTPQALAQFNETTLSSPLKAGQTLKVPHGEAARTVEAAPSKPRLALAAVDPSPSNVKKAAPVAQKTLAPIHYPVRQGDTLWSIAEKFNVPVETVCAKNELKPNQKLIPGKLLTIYSNRQETPRSGK